MVLHCLQGEISSFLVGFQGLPYKLAPTFLSRPKCHLIAVNTVSIHCSSNGHNCKHLLCAYYLLGTMLNILQALFCLILIYHSHA